MAFNIGPILTGIGEGFEKKRDRELEMLKLAQLNQLRRDQLNDLSKERQENRARIAYEDSPFTTDEMGTLPESMRPFANLMRHKDAPALLSNFTSSQNAKLKSDAQAEASRLKKSRGNQFLQKAELNISNIERVFNKLDEKLKKAPSGQIMGRGAKALGWLGISGPGFVDATTSEGLRGEIAQLKASLRGESRPSDLDVKYAREVVPGAEMPKDVQTTKLKDLRDIIQGYRSDIMKMKSETAVGDIDSKIAEIEKLLQESQ